MKIRFLILSLTLTLLAALPALSQQQVFRISGFELDQFDLSASSQSKHKKTDGNGDLYAIVKVKSNNPEDNLSAYQFDFGLMNHEPTIHNGELWLYVQKNAQYVTVSRQGFNTVSKYDLQTSLEPGKTYVLHISTTGPVILTQMVQFAVKPVGVNAFVTIKNASQGGTDEPFGAVDENGDVAKALQYGTYTYRVMADGFNTVQGQITLNDRNKTLIENVVLQSNLNQVTLRVNADAEIYVNGQLKGNREWVGSLKAGTYQVECKSSNHKSSSQYITVKDGGQPQTFEITPPTPITGTLAITSQPVGATIYVNDTPYGTSPRNINDLIIGKHTIRLSREGYTDVSKDVEIRENKTTELSMTLQKEKGTSVAQKDKPKAKKTDSMGNTATNTFMKPTELYVSAGGQFVGITGITADVGVFFKNINLEGFFTYGFNQEYIGWATSASTQNFYYGYRPMSYGVKLGYGILMAKTRLRITPQLGFGVTSISGSEEKGRTDASKAYSMSGSVGVRIDVGIVRHFSCFVSPEYSLALSKSPVYEKVQQAGYDTFDKWSSGFRIRLGVRVSF